MLFLDKQLPGPRRDFIGYGRNKPRVVWPNNAAVAINFCIAYEEGGERSLLSGDERGESLSGTWSDGPQQRDLAAESIFEYGSRAGIWRLANLLDDFKIPATLFAAAVALERNPEVCAWVRETQNDICCHGWRWIEPSHLGREEERRRIGLAIASITGTTGRRPIGWRSRTGPSVHTRELLREEGGFLYDSDSYADDLPYFADGQLVLPYTLTYTEGRLVQPLGYTSPADFWETCRLGLDEMRREGKAGYPKMMSIGLHPRHTGQAGRMAGLRSFLEYALSQGDVWFARREDIARHWQDNHGSFGQ